MLRCVRLWFLCSRFIFMFHPSGVWGAVSTIAGSGKPGYAEGERLLELQLSAPLSIAMRADPRSCEWAVVVVDSRNRCVRCLPLPSMLVASVLSLGCVMKTQGAELV
jgi:hypothetical protein